MDDLDIKILDELQTDFPIHSEPFKLIAQRLNLADAEVVNRIQKLKNLKIIDKIGAIIEPRKLGYLISFIVIKAPREQLAKILEVVSGYAEICESCLRSHDYNLWLTVKSRSAARLKSIAKNLKEKLEIKDIHILPAVHTFK